MLLNRVFNIAGGEWPRISVVWMIRFLYKVGFVIGWTLLVGLFVARFGIYFLPYLFIGNALFTIAGSLFYSTILGRFKAEHLMISNILLACGTLFLAFQFYFINDIWFFTLLLVATSVFLTQFKLGMEGYIEEMFTPLESERTFPVIEAADTIGGIAAGLSVVFLSGTLSSTSFIFLWVILLILIIPFILVYGFFKADVLSVEAQKEDDGAQAGVFARLKDEFADSSSHKFVKGLLLVVFLQWIMYNLLEFQYTSAVYKNVSDVVLEGGSGFEHAFVHDLGALFILFSGSALLVQLFLGSRLIKSLGIIGSMVLHAVVAFFSFFGLTLSFNFTTAVLAKNNFTITSIIHMNAYHSSYYAVSEKFRALTREFLEGVVRPVGAVVGTLSLILLQQFVAGTELTFSVNVLLLFVTAFFFAVIYFLQSGYTRVALDDLYSNDRQERLNAIDILSQRGHKDHVGKLREILMDKSESVSVRVKVVEAFGEIKGVNVIPILIESLKSKHLQIRLAALEVLSEFSNLHVFSEKNARIRSELVGNLKELYRSEADDSVRSKIIDLLARISHVAVLDFLFTTLNNSRGSLRAHAIMSLGSYGDDSVLEYVRPYLKSSNKAYRAAAIIALGRVGGFEQEVLYEADTFLRSSRQKDVVLGLNIIGSLGLKDRRVNCYQFLDAKNVDLRLNAAIALAKMGSKDSVQVLVKVLFDGGKADLEKVKKLLLDVDLNVKANVEKTVRRMVAEKVKELMNKANEGKVEKLPKRDLKILAWLYKLIEEYDEVEYINNLLTV